MADRVTTTWSCDRVLGLGPEADHRGHFHRPGEPFVFAWCPGTDDDPLPCAVRQGGTWAAACVIPSDVEHDEHRTDHRADRGRYHYWIDRPGGFSNYSARKHDGWEVGASRDPSEDDPSQIRVREMEQEAEDRRARRLSGLRRADRLHDLTSVLAVPTDSGGFTLGPDEADRLLGALSREPVDA